jgi:hypothetical protein
MQTYTATSNICFCDECLGFTDIQDIQEFNYQPSLHYPYQPPVQKYQPVYFFTKLSRYLPITFNDRSLSFIQK